MPEITRQLARCLTVPGNRARLKVGDSIPGRSTIKPGGPVPIRHVKGHVPVPFVKSSASGVILARGR